MDQPPNPSAPSATRRSSAEEPGAAWLSALLRPIQGFRLVYLPLVTVFFAYGALGLIDVDGGRLPPRCRGKPAIGRRRSRRARHGAGDQPPGALGRHPGGGRAFRLAGGHVRSRNRFLLGLVVPAGSVIGVLLIRAETS